MASIEIAPGWVDAVQQYIEGLMVNSIAAAENATKLFQERVVESRSTGRGLVLDCRQHLAVVPGRSPGDRCPRSVVRLPGMRSWSTATLNMPPTPCCEH